MAKYPNDPHISDRLVSLERDLKSVQKRLNSIISSNRSVYGNGGVGGRLSRLSGKVVNLNAALDGSVSELRKAATEFAQKEQEQQNKAATAVESAKNGVNIAWLGTAAAAAALGTTTVVKPSWLASILNTIKETLVGKETIIKSPDITITGGKPRYVKLVEPGSVFYSNVDVINEKTPYNGLCTNNSTAMVIETVADSEAIDKVVKEANCSDFREYCVKKGFSSPSDPCKKVTDLGCKARVEKIGGSDRAIAEEKIRESLQNSSSGVGYFYFGAGSSKEGKGHAVMVYLDSEGNVMVNDPGGGTGWGKNKSFAEQSRYWQSTGRILNDLVIVERRMD